MITVKRHGDEATETFIDTDDENDYYSYVY